MEATNAEPEPHGTPTHDEISDCHKARIFNVLIRAPVVRAWKHATCDGAVYLGTGHFPKSYADRYFQMSSKDISYVTFSVVTAFKPITSDTEGHEIRDLQCCLPPAQREASEFLIVTFSHDHDQVAILPSRLFCAVEGDQRTSTGETLPDQASLVSYPSSRLGEASPDEISVGRKEDTSLEEAPPSEITGPVLAKYCFSINFLQANIEEIRRMTLKPMHPTTTPFQFGLDGRIPKAGEPKAIVPQAPEQHLEIVLEEREIRALHNHIPKQKPSMRLDFLDYQPLMRDFKIVISHDEEFPSGLEVVISHSFGHHYNLDTSGRISQYADYFLTHGIPPHRADASFVPRDVVLETQRLLGDKASESRPRYGSDFTFEIENSGKWVKDIWKIIKKYPPGEHPTRAEEKQEVWKKVVPWPETEAQVAPLKSPTPHKAQSDIEEPSSKQDSRTGDHVAEKSSSVDLLAVHYVDKARSNIGEPSSKQDSGTGGHVAEKSSDVDLLTDHYMKKASMNDNKAKEDAT